MRALVLDNSLHLDTNAEMPKAAADQALEFAVLESAAPILNWWAGT